MSAPSHASAPVSRLLCSPSSASPWSTANTPDWLAIGAGDAARAAALSPERVRRLASRVAHPFADIVDNFTRRGRPACIDDPVRAELATLRALLAVASSALALVPLRRPAVGALLVGAWQRLSTQLPSLTKGAFCKALSLPERMRAHGCPGETWPDARMSGGNVHEARGPRNELGEVDP